jgi:carbamoylphosphate synthase large subunit
MRATSLPLVCVAKQGRINRNRFVDEMIEADPVSPEAVVSAVVDYESKMGYRPVAVVPVNDWTLWSGRTVADYYGLRFLARDTIAAARNKRLMKERFQKRNLPVPRYCEFSDLEGLEAITKDFGFPLVIKPIDFGGSGGVVKIESASELPEKFAHCEDHIKAHGAAFFSTVGRYVAEQYIVSAHEISVEVMNLGSARKVITVTDKYLGPEPYFAEIGHVVPSVFNGDERIRALAIAACDALGIDVGIAHVEMKVGHGGELTLLEVGARTAGDSIMDQIERAFGINPYSWHVAAYLGVMTCIPEIPEPRGQAAIANLHPRPGTIIAINERPRLADDTVTVAIAGKLGTRIRNAENWLTRQGFAEFFWPYDPVAKRATRHIEETARIAAEVFTIGDTGDIP